MSLFSKTLFLLFSIALCSPPLRAGERSADASALAELTLLARKYEHGEGISKDLHKAHELYCLAAQAGYPDAQYLLGWMYANGRGVVQNDVTAGALFQVAAEQGHLQAKELASRIFSDDVVALPLCMAQRESLITKTKVANAKVVYPKGKVSQLVEKLAPRYSVDPDLAMALIYIESRFNERAVSSKNAQGLMQLTPETALRFNVVDVFDAEENIKGGLSYLRWLLAFFRGNVSLVAAAYNAGERAVEKYHGIPPYFETRDYVDKLTKLYQKTTHPFQRKLVKSSSVFAR